MALTRSDELCQITAEGFGAGTFTTTAFTPPDNSLLVVAVGMMEDAAGTTDLPPAMTVSGGGWTYTDRVSIGVTSAFSLAVKIWTAPVTTGASMTLAIDCGAVVANFYSVSAVAYTGYDTGTPTGAIATGTDEVSPDGAFSITLGSAPAASSEVFAALSVDKESAGTTEGSGWTEICQVQTGASGGLETEVRTGSTSTTVDWVDTHTGTGSIFRLVAAAVEIRAAAGAASEPDAASYPQLPPPLLYQLLAAQLRSLSNIEPEPLTDPWQAPFPPHLLLQLAAWQLRLYGAEEVVAAGGTPQTGGDGLGLSGQGTAVRVAAVTGSTSLGLSGAGTARKSAAGTGRAALGLAGTGTEKKTAPELGRAAIGLAGTGVEKKTVTNTGLAAVGFSGRGTADQNIPRPETGIAAIGLSGRGTEVKRAAQTGVVTLGLSGRGTERKTAPDAGRAAFGLAGSGTERKTAPDTGRSVLGLSGTGTAALTLVAAQTGRAYLGLSAAGAAIQGEVCDIPLPFTGIIARPSTGVLAYAGAGIARPSSGTIARPNSGEIPEPC